MRQKKSNWSIRSFKSSIAWGEKKLFSLVQSCKSSEVNPEKYLSDVMKRLMSHNA
ncbi:MAG: transposase domain-containing protein [Chlamydiia bacterium]|nr:transposase domain-containing protein [Chlamydiia bacterium]